MGYEEGLWAVGLEGLGSGLLKGYTGRKNLQRQEEYQERYFQMLEKLAAQDSANLDSMTQLMLQYGMGPGAQPGAGAQGAQQGGGGTRSGALQQALAAAGGTPQIPQGGPPRIPAAAGPGLPTERGSGGWDTASRRGSGDILSLLEQISRQGRNMQGGR